MKTRTKEKSEIQKTHQRHELIAVLTEISSVTERIAGRLALMELKQASKAEDSTIPKEARHEI